MIKIKIRTVSFDQTLDSILWHISILLTLCSVFDADIAKEWN
jgi:hypothetical protein